MPFAARVFESALRSRCTPRFDKFRAVHSPVELFLVLRQFFFLLYNFFLFFSIFLLKNLCFKIVRYKSQSEKKKNFMIYVLELLWNWITSLAFFLYCYFNVHSFPFIWSVHKREIIVRVSKILIYNSIFFVFFGCFDFRVYVVLV